MAKVTDRTIVQIKGVTVEWDILKNLTYECGDYSNFVWDQTPTGNTPFPTGTTVDVTIKRRTLLSLEETVKSGVSYITKISADDYKGPSDATIPLTISNLNMSQGSFTIAEFPDTSWGLRMRMPT